MNIKTYIIDAFTGEPFKGNPAGVCLLEKPLAAAAMQSIAAELNLSETAFLLPDTSDEQHFHIRYFTPTVEIPFCGHATLASAKLLLHRFQRQALRLTTFHQLELKAQSEGEKIAMQFPLYETEDFKPSKALCDALGLTETVDIRYSGATETALIEVNSKEALLALKPDFKAMLQAPDDIKNVVVTCRSPDTHYDFYSRCFCPWLGIDEDPVTGAVHCTLATHWRKKLGKDHLMAYQASRRGGYLQLEIQHNQSLKVTSEAQIVFEGILQTNLN